MDTTVAYFDFAGSCPHQYYNGMADEQLVNLSDDEIFQIILDNFNWQLKAVDGDWSKLRYLSHGDPGIWRDWLRVPAGNVLRSRLGLKPHDGKRYGRYVDRLRSASKITVGKVGQLGYSKLAGLTWEAYKQFHNQHPDMPGHIKLRFGIATPYSWAFLAGFQFGKMDGFVEAVTSDINRVLSIIPADKVLISFEYPIEQVMVALASLIGRGDKAARHFANQLEQVLAKVEHQPAHIGLHPCWGDLNNEAVIGVFLRFKWLTRRLQSFKNLRRLLEPMQNAASKALKVVLLPLSAGKDLPSLNPEDYEELSYLKLKEDVDYCAGICHEDQTEDQAKAALRAAGGGSGIKFASCGPRCGLSRTGNEKGRKVIAQAISLLSPVRK